MKLACDSFELLALILSMLGFLRYELFWNFTQRRMVIFTDVSGQRIELIFNVQSDLRTDQWDSIVAAETSSGNQYTLRKSQKIVDLTDTAAEA
jgi:hypothetical protein